MRIDVLLTWERQRPRGRMGLLRQPFKRGQAATIVFMEPSSTFEEEKEEKDAARLFSAR